jgi:plastocyanin
MRSRSAATRGIRGVALCVLCAFAAANCGGDGYSDSPTAPTPPPAGGTPATTIGIAGDRGAQSFTPNPATVTQGQTLSFRNNDSQVHRIVFNDNSFDSGNINPGATSDARAVPTNGANYHCSLHPGMVGSISGGTGQPPPPCTGPYC